jgi:hypothetical protein
MLDGLEDASIEMDEAKVCFHILMYSTWDEQLSRVPLKKPCACTYVILTLARARSHHAKHVHIV